MTTPCIYDLIQDLLVICESIINEQALAMGECDWCWVVCGSYKFTNSTWLNYLEESFYIHI